MQNNNAKKEKFIDLLHELFQLNQPELDFGLYRIMHAKSGQIKAFIENDLAREIDDAFAAGGDDNVAELKAAYEQARAQAIEFGIEDPDNNQKVKEAKAAYDAARENGDDPSDIYDHLYRFFSRYYDKGDFLSRRYHVAENDSRAAPYAVPYDGREVYLHWANKDQYYIKSSEYLSNFNFDLAEALKKERERQGAEGQGGFDFEAEDGQALKVTFHLVEAAEGAHNNVKENQSRFFIIHEEMPVEVYDEELVINFEYRYDPKKSGQEANWQKKRLAEAETVIVDALKKEPKAKSYYEALVFLAPTEKQKERTLLGKYLRSYSARNTMDYFIHKDLGSFLRRELDFYIKNEIMRLDDISVGDVDGVTRSVKKITALRKIARQIVDFLALLEDFQKKLWLKKKFVTESNYCLSVERLNPYTRDWSGISEDAKQKKTSQLINLLEIVFSNQEQLNEWEKLFSLNLKKLSQDYEQLEWGEFLGKHEYSYLVVDTGLFDEEVKAEMLSVLENLDEQCDGVILHSDNFQAMSLIENSYKEKVKCVYIDPPYNTDVSSIPYKNDYRHSSWGTLMRDRIEILKGMMRDDAAIFVSIDKVERTLLEYAMDTVFDRENRVEELIWIQNTNDGRAPTYSTNHEYVEVYAKNKAKVENDYNMFREPKPGFAEVMELINKLNSTYPSLEKVQEELSSLYAAHKAEYRESIEAQGLDWEVEKRNDPWKGIYAYQWVEYRDQQGMFLEESEAKNKKANIWVYTESDWTIMSSETKQSDTTRDPNHKNYRYYEPIHPLTGKPCKLSSRGWKGTQYIDPDYPERNSFESLLNDHRIAFGPDETKVPRQKRFLHEVGTNVSKSVFADYSDGEKETTALFGRAGVFLAPKHTQFVKRFISQSTDDDGVILDCFGGSGSTGHAVINMNYDGGARKFVLAEMGNHFDTILKPRLVKAIYSKDWFKGKPKPDKNGEIIGISREC